MDNIEESIDILAEFAPYPLPGQRISKETFISHLLTCTKGQYSYFPELVHILSPDQILQLFHVFSGKNLEFPDKKSFKDYVRNLHIFYAIQLNPTREEINLLSKKYSLTVQTIKRIIETVAKNLDCANPLLKNQENQ